MIADKNVDAARTPNQNCPACRRGALHEPHHWQTFHPLAGHGFSKESGWTHPDLKLKEKE